MQLSTFTAIVVILCNVLMIYLSYHDFVARVILTAALRQPMADPIANDPKNMTTKFPRDDRTAIPSKLPSADILR